MIQKAKKKSLFLVGMLFSGFFGAIVGHINSNYSKDESFFIATANADVQNYTATTWSGDGCAGCSGDASY